MAKFVFVYVGGVPPKEQNEENMKAWGDWIKELSMKGQYEGGYPFGWTKKVVNSDNSVSDYSGENSGYSLINAGSMDEAIEIAKGCPCQKYGGSTEVYDVMEMPAM